MICISWFLATQLQLLLWIPVSILSSIKEKRLVEGNSYNYLWAQLYSLYVTGLSFHNLQFLLQNVVFCAVFRYSGSFCAFTEVSLK